MLRLKFYLVFDNIRGLSKTFGEWVPEHKQNRKRSHHTQQHGNSEKVQPTKTGRNSPISTKEIVNTSKEK
jgi:hypothetical protein